MPLEILNSIPESSDNVRVTRRIASDPAKSQKIIENSSQYEIELEKQQLLDNLKLELPPALPLSDILDRQGKVNELLLLCDKVDLKIDSVIESLLTQTKDYDYQVDISNDPLLKKAVRKIFKKPLDYINKEMYLFAIEKMRKLQESEISEALENG